METKETRKRILNEKELEQIVGGFEYEGILEWLRGYNISCPNCRNENAGSVKKRYATGLHIYYTCEHCEQKFFYTLGPANKVIVVNE